MSRSPWADQSRRSDIRHLRDGSSHRSLTRRLTQARTQTQSEHIVGHVAGVRTITENQHKHALNRGGGQGREIVRRQTCWAESFPSQILCLSPISAILLSACQLDEMTPTLIRLCSTQLLHLSHAHWLKIAYLAQGHRQWFSPRGREREPDVQLPLFACLRLCSIPNCLCERLWPVGGKWYRQQQPFCICLY